MCYSPEYPSGIHAYFVTIEADGTPAYPFVLAAQYYGIVLSTSTTTKFHLVLRNMFTPTITRSFVQLYGATFVLMQLYLES
ncbi:MAG: hypothetical protein IPL95_13380 [Saprospiraceae bacterium]|nr:hypothetical protein [Saprospiraceae bacterium]